MSPNSRHARAFGLEAASGGGAWGRLSLFLTFALMPALFVIGAIRAGLNPAGLRAKFGLFGASISAFSLYQPDFFVLLVATAVSGVLWAVFRLWLFYNGKAPRNSSTAA